MDLNGLIEDPVEFIQQLAETSDIKPDFGLRDAINQKFDQSPDFFLSIPLVSTLSEFHQFPPGKLVRFRCQMVSNVGNELLPLRYEYQGKFYSPLASLDIPEDVDFGNPHNFIDRKLVLVSSLPCYTQWLKNQQNSIETIETPNLSVFPNKFNTDEIDDTFYCIAKSSFFTGCKPGFAYDLIGFFENMESFIPNQNDLFEDEGFINSLNTFVALAQLPVSCLYSPFPQGLIPEMPALRDLTLSFLTNYFGPRESEIILLWFMGRVRGRTEVFQKGIFSLNIFGLDTQSGGIITQLFDYLCTTLGIINFSIENLNSIDFRPEIKNNQPQKTPFSVAHETRIIINELALNEGKLNETGIMNIKLIQDLMNDQVIPYIFDDIQTEIPVSLPILILSNQKTLLFPDILIPINSIDPQDINVDSTTINMIRYYLEESRNLQFSFNENESEVLQPKICEMLSGNPNLTQRELHILMNIAQLICISMGVQNITVEIWDHAVELFSFILQYKKNQ